ncbi:MAG: TIGR03790 family protein [Synechococcaceae cyanobacterium]|nr:TIGR03790 family protein [Synechococcaceae cyanobacterium]
MRSSPALLPALTCLLVAVGLRGARPERSAAGFPPLSPAEPFDARHLALVINDADPLSRWIGDLYRRRRGIPAHRVIRVRFPAGEPVLAPPRFRRLRQEILQRTPAEVQAYALAWMRPYRVGCQSITAALTLGYDGRNCVEPCGAIPRNPLHARHDVHRPWQRFGMRPSMLLAARNPEQARALIDRGIAADGTAPGGTVYLMETGDSSRNVRAVTYPRVQRWLGERIRIEVVRADALRGAPDVLALFTGLAWVPDIGSNRYRPGAVADHLTSLGGMLPEGPQMSALAWLEAGATGSYGTVVEPCNLPAKFPDPATFLLAYRGGATLIEAYWKSVAMPGQGVFVGEPLARPWGPQARSKAIRRE